MSARCRSTLARYRIGDLRRAGRMVYDVEANWKVIVENYSECLHCPGVHPELNRLSHYLSGDTFTGAGAWCGGSMTLADDAETMARRRRRHGAAADRGRRRPRAVLYFALFPNALVSLHPDYVMLHTLWPREPGRTEVVCDWFFEAATMAGGVRPLRRDRLLGPGQPRGLARLPRSRSSACRPPAYTPGRYTTQEGDVHAFDRMVADRYFEALAPEATS